jgi:hypothetical protein
MSIRNGRKQEKTKQVRKHSVDRFIGLSEIDDLNDDIRKRIEKKIKEAANESIGGSDGIYMRDVLTRKEIAKFGIPSNAFVVVREGKADNVFIGITN